MSTIPRYLPCGVEPVDPDRPCDGDAGDDIDPDFYCCAGVPWQEHDENPDYLEDEDVRAAEDRIEAGQARWSETGTSRKR